MAELSSCTNTIWPAKPKIVSISPFTKKKFANPYSILLFLL